MRATTTIEFMSAILGSRNEGAPTDPPLRQPVSAQDSESVTGIARRIPAPPPVGSGSFAYGGTDAVAVDRDLGPGRGAPAR